MASESLIRDAAPRGVASSQLSAAGVAAVGVQVWAPEDAAGLLRSAALSAPGGAGGGGAPATLWAGVVAGGAEPVGLAAELWAVLPGGNALARGVPVGEGAWWLPLPASLTAQLSDGSGAAPTGFAVTLTAATWTLVGAPTSGVYGIGGVSTPSPPAATPLHTVFLPPVSGGTAAALSATVPPNTLIPGYLYRASVAFRATLSWSFSSSATPWPAPPLPPLPSGFGFPGSKLAATDTLVGVPFASAYAPLLLAHSPPAGGALSASPTSGTALVDSFALTPGAFADVDALVVSGSVPAFGAASPAPTGVLLLLAGGGVVAVGGAPQATCAAAGGAAYAALAAALAARAGWVGTLDAACATAQAAQIAAAALAPGGAYPSALTGASLQLYVDVGGAAAAAATAATPSWPQGLAAVASGAALSLTGWAALAAKYATDAQLAPAATLLMPGFALLGAPAAFSAPFSTTVGSSVNVVQKALIGLLVLDRFGAPGVAWVTLTVTPLVPPSAPIDTAVAALAAVTLAGSGAAGTASLQTAAAASALLAASLSGAAGAPLSDATAAVVASVQTSLAQSLAAALVAAPAGAAGGGGAPLPAATVTAALTALQSLASTAVAPSTQFSAAAVAGVNALLAPSTAAGSTAPPPAATVTGVLNVLSALSGSTTASSPAAAPPPGYTAPVDAAPLSLPTGGMDPDLAANITSTLGKMASSLAAAAAPAGTVVPLNSAPPEATDGSGASYCGAAVQSSAMTLTAASSSLAVDPPLNPCFPTAANARPVTLPAAIIAAQPKPAVALPPSVVASLMALSPGGSVTLQLTQWGTSPVSETAGVGAVTYKPPPAVSDTQLAAQNAAAAAEAAAGLAAAAGGRALGIVSSVLSSLHAAVAGSGGTSAGSATSGALLDAAPRPTVAYDMLPNRPMDSRTVSLSVLLPGGARPSRAITTARPFNITIPLRDLSIVNYDARSGAARGVDIGASGFAVPAFNVTCPRSPAAAAAGIAARRVDTPGAPVPLVTVVKATRVGFTGVVGAAEEASVVGDDAGIAAPDGTSASTSLLSPGGVGAPTVAAADYTYVLSVDCGAAFGARTFACGVGMGGSTVLFACPAVLPVPVCLWLDPATGRWSSADTAVVATSLTSVTCNTTHVADHAVRFAALAQQQADIFAAQAPLTSRTLAGVWPGVFVVVGLLLVGFPAAAATWARAAAARRWAAALALDASVAWAKERGTVSAALLAGGSAATAKVAPGDAATGDRASPPVKSVAVSPTAKALPVGPGGRLAEALARLPSAHPLTPLAAQLLRAAAPGGTGAGAPTAAAPGFPANALGKPSPAQLVALVAAWRKGGTGAGACADDEELEVAALPPLALPAALLLRLVGARAATSPPALLAALWHLLPCCPSHRAYHPTLPSASGALTRAALALASSLTACAAVAVLYAYLLGVKAGSGSITLPALSAGQVIALALATALLVAAPVDAALRGLASAAGRERWEGRGGPLAEELALREHAAALLSPYSTAALLRALQGPGAPPLLTPEEAAALEKGGPGAAEPDVASLRALVEEARGARAKGGAPQKPPLAAYALLVALLALTLFPAYYLTAFVLTRGPAAAASLTVAWVLAELLAAVAGHALAAAAAVALAATTAPGAEGEVSRADTDADALAGWLRVAAPALATAATAGGSAKTPTLLLALTPLSVVLRAAGGITAEEALRRVLLGRFYAVLVARAPPAPPPPPRPPLLPPLPPPPPALPAPLLLSAKGAAPSAQPSEDSAGVPRSRFTTAADAGGLSTDPTIGDSRAAAPPPEGATAARLAWGFSAVGAINLPKAALPRYQAVAASRRSLSTPAPPFGGAAPGAASATTSPRVTFAPPPRFVPPRLNMSGAPPPAATAAPRGAPPLPRGAPPAVRPLIFRPLGAALALAPLGPARSAPRPPGPRPGVGPLTGAARGVLGQQPLA